MQAMLIIGTLCAFCCLNMHLKEITIHNYTCRTNTWRIRNKYNIALQLRPLAKDAPTISMPLYSVSPMLRRMEGRGAPQTS